MREIAFILTSGGTLRLREVERMRYAKTCLRKYPKLNSFQAMNLIN